MIALVVAAAGFTPFVRRQRRQTHPLIGFALLRDPRILSGMVAAGIVAGSLVHRTGPRPLIVGGLVTGTVHLPSGSPGAATRSLDSALLSRRCSPGRPRRGNRASHRDAASSVSSATSGWVLWGRST
ncbi:hypothetical protein [Streptomyces niveus]|uniref:hypothetical protein n=1 Tax=Streptomyces niveus TaxID=193462 RepID=UPI0036C9B66B